VQIQFQDRIVMVKGKGLEPLCDALERLAVERIRVRPEKYENVTKSEGVVNEIEITEGQQKVLHARCLKIFTELLPLQAV